MRSINKKGLSDLLAVVLMIGMSAVALTLLGTFLFGLSEQTAQFAPAVSCFEMNSKIESVCYKEQELQIELKRGIMDFLQCQKK
jgi:predicted PurR-regulated permease PerM